jgi:hypothetical protein
MRRGPFLPRRRLLPATLAVGVLAASLALAVADPIEPVAASPAAPGGVRTPTPLEATDPQVQAALDELQRALGDQVSVEGATPSAAATAAAVAGPECSTTFTGAAGSTSFVDPGNWSGAQVPGSGDVACVPVGTTARLATADTIQVSALLVDGRFELASGLVEIGDVAMIADLSTSGGALGGQGSVEVTGSFEWTGGRLQGTGDLTIVDGATASLPEGGGQELARTLINHGTFTMEGPSLVLRSDIGGGSAHFDNRGTVQVSGPTVLTAGASSGGSVDNSGTIEVDANLTVRKLDLTNDDGSIEIDAAELALESPFDASQLAGSVTGETGSLALKGFGWELTGSVDVAVVQVGPGSSRVAPGATFRAGATAVLSGSFDLDAASADVSVGQLQVTNGSLGGSTDLTTDRLSWSGGRIVGSGTLTVASGGTGRVFGTPVKDLGRRLVNQGELTVTAPLVQFRTDLGGAAVLDNQAEVLVSAASTWRRTEGATTGAVVPGEVVDAGELVNTGTLTVESTLTLDGVAPSISGEVELVGSASLTTPRGLRNEGTISLAERSVLGVGGDYVQASGATLRVRAASLFADIQLAKGGALPPAATSGLVQVDGQAALDGALVVETHPTLQAGAVDIVVVDADRLVGAFASIEAPGWGVAYDAAAGDVVLTHPGVAPLPPTILVAPQSFAEGTGTALVSVQVVGGSTPITVPVAFIDGTATSPGDFTGSPQTVTLAPNATASVPVAIQQDELDEADEAFTISVGGTLAQITILDDDPEPRLVIDDGELVEGDDGTTALVFSIRLVDPSGLSPRASGRAITVAVQTEDGSAIAPGDYEPRSLVLTIPAGVNATSVSVPVVGDTDDEDDEQFEVVLSSPVHAVVLDGTAVGTIRDDDGSVATDELVEQLNAGRPALAGSLPSLAGAFDLDGFDLPALGLDPFELPVVTDDLGSAFATTEAVGEQDALPFDALTGTVDDALDQLEAAGVTIDHVVGGVGGRPEPSDPGDLLQGRYTVRLGDLAEVAGFAGDDLNDDAAGVLEGLASSLGLDGDFVLAADLELLVVFGVDDQGFYVADETALTLEVSAEGTVEGRGRVAGAVDTEVQGTGAADLAVGLALTAGPSRLRSDDLTGDPFDLLRPSAEGDASLDLGLTAGPAELRWSADVAVATSPSGQVDVELDATLDGELDLAGLTVEGGPASIVLEGRFEDDTWTLDGELDGPDTELAGYPVERARFSISVGPDAFAGAAELAMTVAVGGTSPTVELDVDLLFDRTSLAGSARVEVDELEVGASPTLLYLRDAVLELDLAWTFAAGPTEVAVQVAAVDAVVLPEPAAPGQIPDGAAAATQVAGSVDAAGNVALSFGTLTGSVADAVDFRATDVAFAAGPDAAGPVLSVASLGATIPELDGLRITFAGFRLGSDGRFGATSVAVDSRGLAATFGIADLLPFDVTSVTATFPDPEDLDQLAIEVEGGFDQEALASLPFTPVVGIGGEAVDPTSPAEDNRFRFSIAVDSLAEGDVRPLDLGPITLGLRDVEVGEIVLAAQLTLGGYEAGEWVPDVSGTVEIESGIDGIVGQAQVELTGDLDLQGPGATLDLAAAFEVSGKLGDAVDIEGATLDFDLGITVDEAFSFDVRGPTLAGAGVGRVAIRLSDVVELVATDLDLDFDPPPGQPLISFGGGGEDGGLTVEFGEGTGPFAGWGGTAGNIGIGADLRPILLPGFFVDVIVPDDESFGLPDSLPVRVDEVGLRFPNLPGTLPPGGVPLDDAGSFAVRFSGGLVADDEWPISAEIDGLEVDLGLLAAGEFPITNLDGFGLGIEPFELVPGFRVGGSLALGTVDVDGDDVFYGRISGEFSYEGIGAGVDLVVTEYGPVLAKLQVPVGMPLDPTGLVLASVEGGLRFGGAPFPSPDRPLELLGNPAFDTTFPITSETIAASVERSVAEGRATWDDGFTLALSGNIAHLLAPGVVSGQVTLGANVGFGAGGGLKLIGTGDLDFYGMPFAGAAMLLDLSDPLAPTYDFAIESPTAGSPLGFVLPARAEFELSLDTEGLVMGTVLGARAFVEQLAAGAVEVGQAAFTDALAVVAEGLEQDHGRPLAQLLLDVDGDGSVSPGEDARAIDAAFVVARLLGGDGVAALLPVGASGLPADPERGAVVVRALLDELLAAVATVGQGDLAAVAADPDLTRYLDLLGTGSEAVAAFAGVVRTAAISAGSAFFEQFDPKFVLRGQLQPVIAGIPFGNPDQRVTLTIGRDGVSFGFDTSVLDIAKKIIEQAAPFVGQSLTSLLTLMTLGFEDTLGMTFQLPLEGVPEALLAGEGLPVIDPFADDWAIELRGGLKFLDFQVGRMTGLLVPPRNEAFLEQRIQKVWEAPDAPIDPARIPVQTPEHYDGLFRHGGLLLTGQLFLPELLTDPAALLAELDLEPPDDPLAIPAWLSEVGETLGRLDEPARVQVFLPSFAEVLDLAPDADTEAERIGFTTDGDELATTLEDIASSAYLEGTWTGTLLSLPIGSASVAAGVDGVEVSGQVPLLGAEARFVLDDAEVEGTSGSFRLPRAAAEISLDSDDLRATLARLGLPEIVDPSSAASARARLLTPGYDPSSEDPFERSGGIELAADLDIEGLVDGAAFRFAIAPPDGAEIPDFTATASVDELDALGAIEIRDAELEVVGVDGAVTVGIDGEAEILGASARVEGQLAPDLTGELAVDLRGAAPQLAGFDLQAGFRVVVTRGAGGTLQAEVAFAGDLGLPSWLGGGRVRAEGELGTDGEVAIEIDAAGLRLLGFRLDQGSITVTGDATDVEVAFDAAFTFSGAALRVTGSVRADAAGPTGTLQVSFAASGGSLAVGPVAVRGQLGLTVGRTSARLTAVGTAAVPGIGTSLAIAGDLGSDGTGSLRATASTIDVKGFSLSSGGAAVATIVRTSSATTMSVDGRLAFLGTSLAARGSLTLAVGGPTGSLGLSVASSGSSTIGFAGWNLEGGVTLSVTPSSARVAVSSRVDVPGVANDLSVSGSLDTALLGSLTVSASTLRLGGSTSAFAVSGSFTLARTATSGGSPVVRFGATNPLLTWVGVTTIGLPTFSIASDGSASVAVPAASVAVGEFTGSFGASTLEVTASPLRARLRFGGATLAVRNLAQGSAALGFGAFDVDSTGDFAVAVSSGALGLDAFGVRGRLVFERVGGVLRLRVTGTPGSPARVSVPGLGGLELNEFSIATNGTFAATASVRRFGPAALQLRDASFTLRKTSSALSSIRLDVTGGRLGLPVGDPIPLPSFSIDGDAEWQQDLVGTGLTLGPVLRTSSNPTLRLRLSGGVFSASLVNPVAVTAVAGSLNMTLSALRVATDGSFTGRVTGQLGVLGFRLAQGTFDLTKVGPAVRLTIPSSNKVSVDLGPTTFSVSGFVQSDGRFDLSGSGAVDLRVLGVGLVGTATARIRNSGITGTVTARACAGACVTLSSAAVSSAGQLIVTVAGIRAPFQIWNPGTVPADRTPPVLAPTSDITVVANVPSGGGVAVNYPIPAASDDVTTSPTVTCSPGSGTTFAVGARSVSCTARDGAGNTSTRSFVVTVVHDPGLVSGLQLAIGSQVDLVAGGFAGLSGVAGTLFSDPQDLGTRTTDDQGVLRWKVIIPEGTPPGDHHIVLEGVDPNGAPRLIVYPVEILGDATTPTPPPPGGPEPPAAPIDPSDPPTVDQGTLPRTGTSSTAPVRLALALLVLGLSAMVMARRLRHPSSHP